MRRKLVGIFIVMLLFTIIPSTSIATNSAQDDTLLFLKGTVIIGEIENNTIYGLALRLFYFQSTETERNMGWVSLNEVLFPDGFKMITIGRLAFVIGVVEGQGGIEVL